MTAPMEPMHPSDPKYVYVPRGDICLKCLTPKGEWHNHPTCSDCGAFVHVIAEAVERCPWSAGPRDCRRPFRRSQRPDLAGVGSGWVRGAA
jgi:hypothetical protein